MLALATRPTDAAELKLSVDTRLGGDNSVVRRNEKSEPDGYFAIAPQASVRDNREELTYDFRYRPTYRAYMTINGIDGVDHFASGSTNWRITPIDTMGFEGRFRRDRRFRQLLIEDASLPSIDPDRFSTDENDRDKIQRSVATAYYSHSFTTRISGRVDYRFDDIDYSQEDQVDTRAHTASLSTYYVFDPKTTVGLAATARFRNNPGIDSANQFSSSSQSGDVSFILRRAITQTIDFAAQAGPSFIGSSVRAPQLPTSRPFFSRFPLESSAGPCSFFTPGNCTNQRTQTTQSFFASVSLSKSWRKSGLEVSYTRSEASGGGTSASSIIDRVLATLDHRISERMSFRLSGAWSDREEVDSAQGNDQKLRRYRLAASLERRLARRITLIGQFSFTRQERTNSNGNEIDNDFLRGFVALRYSFDPIRF